MNMLSLASLALTFVSWVLVMAAVIGPATNQDSTPIGNIELTALGQSTTIHLGTKKFSGSGISGDTKYSDCKDTLDVCDDCDKAGKVYLGLGIVSVILLFASVVVQGLTLQGSSNQLFKIVVFGANIIFIIFALASIANFAVNCTTKVTINLFAGSGKIDEKPMGTATCLFVVAMVLQIFSLILYALGGSDDKEQESAAAAAEGEHNTAPTGESDETVEMN